MDRSNEGAAERISAIRITALGELDARWDGYSHEDIVQWVPRNIDVPPVVRVRPPAPTGMMIDVIHLTEDYNKQYAAAKTAEQRAREIMRKYTGATLDGELGAGGENR